MYSAGQPVQRSLVATRCAFRRRKVKNIHLSDLLGNLTAILDCRDLSVRTMKSLFLDLARMSWHPISDGLSDSE